MKSHSILILVIMMVAAVAGRTWATKTIRYRTTVVDIVDGDTIVITNKVVGHGVTMRPQGPVDLDAVDAPELDQAGGPEAKAFLEKFVKGKEVFIVELTDGGKSRGAWVFVDSKKDGKRTSVNAVMLQKGFAWHTKPKAHYAISFGEPKEANGQMSRVQKEAKDKKAGIWAKENPTPPWEWRKRKEKEAAEKKKQGASEEVSE